MSAFVNCSECESDLRPGDRFCGRCGSPVVRLIESGSLSGDAKVGSEQHARKPLSSKIDKAPEFDLSEKGAAIGAALAEEILPGSEAAKKIATTLGRRLAEKIVRAPLISFGTDPASAALAAARTKATKKKRKKRSKKAEP